MLFRRCVQPTANRWAQEGAMMSINGMQATAGMSVLDMTEGLVTPAAPDAERSATCVAP